ncbi:PhzF family phenazine biosynthesis protein [Massilia soli]|uniref:PhzF family phenazine biosynthesis protein n=1 Tax=Massilia soli TaxID=2792854 RepID=A0ABS7SL11_9BURK|nr:PhzF family phenazine biosynthesis protein [Massilia soli]MBZ2206874.1 PhzF family phenazine biosynthesis protein [Massilia soli]
MPALPFKQVDVFTRKAFMGNPVAVILDGAALSTEQMQQIANWTNLSETTFVVPVTQDGADYHVRIFTPNAELPFAGHPTIGTAHALLEAGMVTAKDGVLVQQCRKGLIRLKVEEALISLRMPEAVITPLSQAQCDELDAVLGLRVDRTSTPCLIDVGARWVVAQVDSAQAVLDARPDFVRMKEQDKQGRHTGVVIFGPHAEGQAARIEIRAFAPAHGIDEDPVCGSGSGCVGEFIRHSGQVERFGGEFVASQGAAVGRDGRIRLALGEQAVEVGGYCVTCVDGALAVAETDPKGY